jgi:serine/threonine protein kinase
LSNITFNSAFHSNSTSVSENDSTLFLFNDLTLEKEKIGIHSFDLISLIGKGSFGEVYLVEKKSSHELFALKVLSKDKIISQNPKNFPNYLKHFNK